MMSIERVPCEKCGNLVASTSRLCPVCGSTSPNGFRNGVAGLAIIGVIGFVIFSLVTGHHGASGANASNLADQTTMTSDIQDNTVSVDEPTAANPTPVEQPTPAEQSDDQSSQPDANSSEQSARAETMEDIFQPLQSQSVKDAIHDALTSGETQRWKDGRLSGYAVPSTPGANGCRTVRYTVDQRPSDEPQTITACDASSSQP